MYRRRGLGHRSLLSGLWPARQRRHHHHVRRGAQLPGQQPHEPGGGQAPGHHPLHSPHRHPRPDGQGQRGCRGYLPFEPAHHGIRGWTHQPGSLGVVLPHHRRRALPHRRYLVADRDRRHPDHSASRRHRPETGLRNPSLLRGTTGTGW